MTATTQEVLKHILEKAQTDGLAVEKLNKKLLIYIIKRLDRIERKINEIRI